MSPRLADRAIVIACPGCDAKGHAVFGQGVVNATLRWSISISDCLVAGHIEEDGCGGGPEALRSELLATHGIWSIRIDGVEKLQALQIVKRAIPDADAKGIAPIFLRHFPELAIGTHAEAEWVIAILAQEGIEAALWGTRYAIEAPKADELPDPLAARALLAEHEIEPAKVVEASLFPDKSLSIVENRDGALVHLGFGFDPERAVLITAALWALGIQVTLGEGVSAQARLFETSP